MTDDNKARYRSSDPFAHAPGPDGQGSDPLAELARLIGQSDPFSDLHRTSRAPAPREPQPYDDPAPPQAELPYDTRPGYDRRDEQPSFEPHFDPAYRHEAEPPRAYRPEPETPPAPDWHNPPAPAYDPFASLAHQAQAAPSPALDHHFDEAPSRLPGFHLDPATPSEQPGHPSHDGSLEALLRPVAGFQSSMPPASRAGLSPTPNPDEFYDDVPQSGRRKGLLTVAAVFCLAVVGTGAAFGYRTWVGKPTLKAPPPVIKASVEPSKVAPPVPPAADSSANKITYDRFADRGQNEKVVVREEKLVDIKAAAPAAPTPAPSAVTAAPPPSPANPPSVLTEPKRVRTVPIRPEAPDASVAARTPAAPAPVRQAAAAPSANAPLDLANPVAPPPPRVSAVRQAPPLPPPGTEPLSLAAEGRPPAAAPARSAPTRVASVPSASTTAGNGSYLVQVSSQRSEADAQAAFRSVKSKYSSILGDRQPVIRRAELAGKGTYYRAMVGPFASRDQAVQLCSSLKAAGGDCVVQSN